MPVFSGVKLLGTTETSIALSTKRGRSIANGQAGEPDYQSRQSYARERSKHGEWFERKPACGTYNCYGHIFAARRTSIYEDAEIDKILEDDDYRPLRVDESPQVGDIVLYLWLGKRRHVGLVVKVDYLENTPVPYVLSKWSDAWGESIHKYRDVLQLDWQPFFYTDRK